MDQRVRRKPSKSDQPKNSYDLCAFASGKTLGDVAIARSGDKGINANVGVIAREPSDFDPLRGFLSEARVAACFAALGAERVERFELPNLFALNFVIHGILKNGLRNDAQGKALGQVLLEMPLGDFGRTAETE